MHQHEAEQLADEICHVLKLDPYAHCVRFTDWDRLLYGNDLMADIVLPLPRRSIIARHLPFMAVVAHTLTGIKIIK